MPGQMRREAPGNVERRRVKERRAAELRYHDLFDNAPDMLLSADSETTEIQVCNQTLATALGYTKEEVVGRPIFDLYHPDCAEDVHTAFRTFMETGEVRNAELQLKRRDGSKIDVIVNVSAVRDERGKIRYSRSVWRDITERKQAEEARERAMEELTTSRASLRKLAARLQEVREEERTALARELHDELGQILTAAQMDLGWIRSHAPPDPPELMDRIREAVKLLKEGVDSVQKLSSQLASRHGSEAHAPPHEVLSDREFQVLCLLGSGKRAKQVAAELGLSPNTISTYRGRILEKLNFDGTADLIRYVTEHGLEDMDRATETLHILLIEDDACDASSIQPLLRNTGTEYDQAAAVAEGLALARKGTYDVIVLDVNLPDIRGFELAQRLRAAGDLTPILMLTGLSDEDDIIHGLGAGADGYLTKPFSADTLGAHLRALQRRGEMGPRQVLQFVDVEMDLTSREVHRGGRPIRLTNLEFKLLAALVKRGGQVASTEDLMREVWGLDFDPGTGLVKVHLSRVRRKLEAGGAPRIIESVPRQGYRMVGRCVGAGG